MKNSIVFLGILLVIFTLSCKTQGPKIDIKGITELDKFGALIGKADSSDWRTDDKWIESEKKLFSDSFSTKCPYPQKFSIMFYPNPCKNKSTLYAIKDSSVRLAIRLVDKNYNVIMANDSVFASAMTVDMSSFKTNDTVRLYYKFITKDHCEFRGHGDILVQPYK
jgi:hypothetical protein